VEMRVDILVDILGDMPVDILENMGLCKLVVVGASNDSYTIQINNYHSNRLHCIGIKISD
jgi:hypothetical protein